ncbi:MAG: hypothetical protein HFJ27_02520 [Clostridia bacterium]|nr:hypothetical protein [Clostridia bacterium]
MYINQNVANEIYQEAGPDRLTRANNYVRQKRVSIENIYYENSNNFSITAEVEGHYDDYKVKVVVKNGELEQSVCECEDYHTHYAACKHIVATLLEVDGNPKYNENQQGKKTREKHTEFKDLINTFYEDEMKLINSLEQKQTRLLDTNIKLVPKLLFINYNKELKIEFKIGTNKQLYKLKDLIEFYENMKKKVSYRYGNKLEFIHEETYFEEGAKPILEFILKHAEMLQYMKHNMSNQYRYYGKTLNVSNITLNSSGLDEVFDLLKGQEILIEQSYCTNIIKLTEENPDIKFKLEKINEKEYSLKCNLNSHSDYEILEGKQYTYFLTQEKLYRCKENYQETTLKILEIFRRNYTTEIKFSKEELSSFFSIILPKASRLYHIR